MASVISITYKAKKDIIVRIKCYKLKRRYLTNEYQFIACLAEFFTLGCTGNDCLQIGFVCLSTHLRSSLFGEAWDLGKR